MFTGYIMNLLRSYKGTAVILFSREKNGDDCGLVTVDVSDTSAEVRSTYYTKSVTGKTKTNFSLFPKKIPQ